MTKFLDKGQYMEYGKERKDNALRFFDRIGKITDYIKSNVTDKPMLYSYMICAIGLLVLIFSPNIFLTNASFLLLCIGVSSVSFFQLSKAGEEYKNEYYGIDEDITPESENWYGYENNWPVLDKQNTVTEESKTTNTIKTFEQIWNPSSIDQRPNT